MKISGSSVLTAGTYDDINVSGKAVIEGDAAAANVAVSGSMIVKGALRADTVSVQGKMVAGDIVADELKTNGKTSVTGDVTVKNHHNNGKLTIDGNCYGDVFGVSGKTSISGNCEVEQFTSNGQVHIDGLLNADEITLQLINESFIRELGGNHIIVKKKASGGLFNFGSQEGMLTSELIEGDDITLEHVTANVVRGRHVTIGTGCHIDLVEYSGSIDIDGRSTVKEQLNTGM